MAKKILNEATVRRFMKLASIDKLSESYFDEIKEEEEEVEESKDKEVNEKEEDVEETVDEEISLPEEEEEELGGEMDMGAEEPAAEEEPEMDQTAEVAAALQTIADALGAAGIDVTVDDSGEEEVPMDAEMPAEEEPEMAEEELSTAPVLDEEYYQSVKEQVIARLKEEFAAKIQTNTEEVEEIQEDDKKVDESEDEE